jgi:hypothetical protein
MFHAQNCGTALARMTAAESDAWSLRNPESSTAIVFRKSAGIGSTG